MLDIEKQHNMNDTNGNTSTWVNYLLAKKEYIINKDDGIEMYNGMVTRYISEIYI